MFTYHAIGMGINLGNVFLVDGKVVTPEMVRSIKNAALLNIAKQTGGTVIGDEIVKAKDIGERIFNNPYPDPDSECLVEFVRT